MVIDALLTFIRNIERDIPENIMEIFFVRKQASSYRSYMPQISSGVQNDVLTMILPVLIHQLNSLQLVDYNPIGVADGEMEMLTKSDVPNVDLFMRSIDHDELLTDEENLEISNIAFYCIRLTYNESTIYLFRQFSKLKKLRKGYIARLFNTELIAMDKEFIGIDETTDIILSDDKMYILNHISLERVFNYRDKYLQATNEAMGELLNKAVIANMEQFADDCSRDVRAMKRITDIMTKGRLPLFFENFDKVPSIVELLGIDIGFDDEGKLIYRDRSQLFPIIYPLSDVYFKSLIAERAGIAKTEEVIQL